MSNPQQPPSVTILQSSALQELVDNDTIYDYTYQETSGPSPKSQTLIITFDDETELRIDSGSTADGSSHLRFDIIL